ncbi:MAG: GNAT family N-acetyltransferase [Candidatus Delongbacteria bacterium]|nr:GNAT family N-acetyltransferase [Candidatus Delongbacteria bacterium]
MKEGFLFRRLKKNEVHLAVQLVRNSFESVYLIPSIYRASGIEDFILLELENQYSPYEYYVVAAQENFLYTFAEFKNVGNTAFLNIIVTSKDHKKAGFGNLLFESCRDGFLAKGINTIDLDVFASNTIAVGWYEKLDFEVVDKQYLYKAKSPYCPSFQQGSLQLLNYPQFSMLKKLLGFSFLEFIYQKEYFKVGVIGNIFIVRSTYSKKLVSVLLQICRYLQIEDIYFLVNDENIPGLAIVDSILRMRFELLHK